MDFTKLDRFMLEMPKRGIPGCELAVSKNGRTVYRTYVGYADSAKKKPVSNADIYWIYSATKVITCLAAMTLVEEGKLGLDDPVSRYIPEYGQVLIKDKEGNLTKPENEMKIMHLFTMAGGLTYDINTTAQNECTDRTTLGMVKAIAKDNIRFEPGSHYRYSLCHDVLAAVVEVVSGMRFSEYLDKKFFTPLGIKDMGFRPNEEQQGRFAAMYRYNSATNTALEIPVKNGYILTPEYESGGAGLFSTVDEYMKIISAIANGGTSADGVFIMKPETVKMMTKNYLSDVQRTDLVNGRLFGYGWGLCGRVHMDPVVSGSLSPVGEFGWDGAAAAFSMIDPKEKVALYFGIHCHNCGYAYNYLHPTLRNLAYEALNS